MNFELSAQDLGFREEVRQFMRTHVPKDLARRTYVGPHPPSIDDYRTWQHILFERGWGAPHWPVEHGGTDWTALRKHIFMEELYQADALDYGWQGTRMIGPVLIAFGSPAQKDRFLPPMLRGDEYWCQGFSEPGAGSDLASLRTKAQRVGDEWVVSGQKIWTSDAHYADWGFFLVRTEVTAKPQNGISMLLIPMDAPGLTVRPIRDISGGTELNEVFLDDVRVPLDHLVGEPGKGWTYAKHLLQLERTASASLYFNRRELQKTLDIARQERRDGLPLIECSDFRRRYAGLEADLRSLEWSVLRILAAERSDANADAIVSALKIRGSELQQRVTELQMDALGLRGLRDFGHEAGEGDRHDLWPDHVPGRSAGYLHLRAATLYGGSREIQKNIIAKLAFGL